MYLNRSHSLISFKLSLLNTKFNTVFCMLEHDHFLNRIAASGVYVAMKYLHVFDEQSRFVSVL